MTPEEAVAAAGQSALNAATSATQAEQAKQQAQSALLALANGSAIDAGTLQNTDIIGIGRGGLLLKGTLQKLYDFLSPVLSTLGVDLASSAAGKGAELVGYSGSTVKAALDTHQSSLDTQQTSLNAHQSFIDSLNTGGAASAGTLLDDDIFNLTRGAGLLDSPLSALATYVLNQVKGAGRVSGLQATMVAPTLTATAWRVIAMSAAGTIVAGSPGALTCNVNTAGPVVGGRDQAGAFSANSWVHFHYIFNGTDWGIIASASATAPTLPAGYTHWQYLGTIRMEGAAMRDMRIFGSTAHFTIPNSLVVNGTATALTDLSATVVQVIPPQASRYALHCYYSLTSDGSGVADGRAYIRETSGGSQIMVGAQTLTGLGASQVTIATPYHFDMVNNQQCWYQHMVTAGSTQKLTLEVNSYTVPNGDN